LEAQVAAFASGAAAGQELALDLEDAFVRLLAHGIAAFHSLQSSSRDGPGGRRQVVLQQRRAPAAASPAVVPGGSPVACADVLWLLDAEGGLSARSLNEAFFAPRGSPTAQQCVVAGA
jgi:hypothetical protein